WRNSLSISPFESPTPPSPMCPLYGSLLTKVIGTLWRSFRLRRSASRISAHSYAGPTPLAPCTAPTTTGPGASRQRGQAPEARPGGVEKALVGLEGPLGMLERADRHAVRVGPETRYLVECELRPRSENEIIVLQRSAVIERERVTLGRDAGNGTGDEVDTFAHE